jgi:hypothetical protein
LSCNENKIIFVPRQQGEQDRWHRYDCETKTIETYPNPFYATSNSAIAGAYAGGVFDPLSNKIIFVPVSQANQSTWHRYDCSTQSVEAYPNPFHSTSEFEEFKVLENAYLGGVFDPINNQIIFVPRQQGGQTTWHKYNCSTQAIETYPNPFYSGSTPQEYRAVGVSYVGGVYDFLNNQIIFAPYDQADQTSWHRYDCSTQRIETYPNPFYSGSTPEEDKTIQRAYWGGVYDPINNQIVFVPFAQANRTSWHALQNYGSPKISRQFAAHYLFNKF